MSMDELYQLPNDVKQRWSELVTSEARFRTIYENAQFMIDSFDRHGKAVLWNQACVDILGYTKDELNQASDILALFYPDEQVKARVLDNILHPTGEFREFKVRHRSGQFLWQMWANFTLFDGSVISVGYDITQRKQAAALDEERVQLVAASKFVALGEMSAGLAHEINNPLAIISGQTYQLKELLTKGKLSSENGIERLDKISNAIERISKVVTGLSVIAKDASSDPRQRCLISSLVLDVLTLCHERFRRNDVDLRLQIEASGVMVLCRPIEIQQVVLHLVNNAFDAVQPKAGSPNSEKWVEVSLSVQDQVVNLVVVDSGPGFDPRTKDKIFQPFFTTKPLGKGTGLGLSVSKSIIETHGGSLRLAADQPRTTVIVCLPVA